MDALVEHINAEQQLQPIASVCLEARKCLVGVRVIGIGFVYPHIRVHSREPLRHMGHHLVHMFLISAEHDVLASLIRDMMGKDLV